MEQEEILDTYRAVIFGKLDSETEKHKAKAIAFSGSWEAFEKKALEILDQKSKIAAFKIKAAAEENTKALFESVGRPSGFISGLLYDIKQIWRS